MRKKFLVQQQHIFEFSWNFLFGLAHICRQVCFPDHSELTVLSCKVYKSLLSLCGIQNNTQICRRCRLYHRLKVRGRNFVEQKGNQTACVLYHNPLLLILIKYVLEEVPAISSRSCSNPQG